MGVLWAAAGLEARERVGDLAEGRGSGRTRKLKSTGGPQLPPRTFQSDSSVPPLLSLHVWGDLEARMW